MVRMQVDLEEKQYEKAKSIAGQSQKALMNAIRKGLDLWIAQQQAEMASRKPKRAFDGYIGIIKSKPREPHMEVDDIYDIPPQIRKARRKKAGDKP